MPSLNLFSWNVAGWYPVTESIRTKETLRDWTKKHSIHILALQETKLSRKRLNSISTEGKISDIVPDGFDAFWSTCETPNKTGFNGVCTMVKKNVHGLDIQVLDVSVEPFDDVSLSREGRLVIVYLKVRTHQVPINELDGESSPIDDVKFIAILNVYAPYEGEGGKRLLFKHKFLKELRGICNSIRLKHFKLILLGDLNIHPSVEDVALENRLVDMELLDLCINEKWNDVAAFNDCILSSLPRELVIALVGYPYAFGVTDSKRISNFMTVSTGGKLIDILKNSWQEIKNKVLYKRKIVSIGNNFQVSIDGKLIGKQYRNNEGLIADFNLRGHHITEHGNQCHGGDDLCPSSEKVTVDNIHPEYEKIEREERPMSSVCIVRQKDHLYVHEICELINKLLRQYLCTEDISSLANTFGVPRRSIAIWNFNEHKVMEIPLPESEREIYNDILFDGMIDSFRYLYPRSRGRFTCWDQSRNFRSRNIGSRIDLILIDKRFDDVIHHSVRNSNGLSNIQEKSDKEIPESRRFSSHISLPLPVISRLPGYGDDYHSASMIIKQNNNNNDPILIGTKPFRTGMVYVSQDLSDHIPVTLCLDIEQKSSPTNSVIHREMSLMLPMTKNISVAMISNKPQKNLRDLFGLS